MIKKKKKKNPSIQPIDSSQWFLSAFIYMQEYYPV